MSIIRHRQNISSLPLAGKQIHIYLQRICQSPFFKHLGMTSLARGFVACLSFILKIVVVRMLTKSDYGLIVTLATLVSYFELIADYAISEIILRLIIREKRGLSIPFSLCIISRVYSVFVAISLFLLTAYFLKYTAYPLTILILSLSIFCSAFTKIPELFFQANEQFKPYAILQTISAVLHFIILAIFVTMFQSFTAYFLGILLSIFSQILVNYTAFRFYFPTVHLQKPSTAALWDLIKESSPLLIGHFFYVLFFRVDTILLEKKIGLEATASYFLAFSIFEQSIAMLWSQFIIVFYPKMVILFDTNRPLLRRRLLQTCLGFGAVFLGLFILVTLFSHPTIVWLFGQHYRDSANLFLPMLPVFYLNIVFSLFYRLLILAKQEPLYLVMMVVASLINLGLTLVFIQHFSVIGAIYATFVVQVLLTMLVIPYSYRYILT